MSEARRIGECRAKGGQFLWQTATIRCHAHQWTDNDDDWCGRSPPVVVITIARARAPTHLFVVSQQSA